MTAALPTVTRTSYSGYLMFFPGSGCPLTGPCHEWELDVGCIPAGSERLGVRRIDGTRFTVFLTPAGDRLAVVSLIGDELF